MEVVTESTMNNFLGNNSCDFSFSPLEGLFGGLLSVWNCNIVFFLASFLGKGFLGTKVRWKDRIYYISNIYSPCTIALKKIFWKDILEVKRKFFDGEWIFGGDFNAVKERNERVGRSSVSNSS